VPSLAPIVPAAASGTDGGASGASAGVARILSAAGQGRAAMAAAAGALLSGAGSKAEGKGNCGSSGGLLVPQTLQLYSILPRPLAGRAKAWGSALNFKAGSETMARPFFDAPGGQGLAGQNLSDAAMAR
jgi:hypothetical protein